MRARWGRWEPSWLEKNGRMIFQNFFSRHAHFLLHAPEPPHCTPSNIRTQLLEDNEVPVRDQVWSCMLARVPSLKRMCWQTGSLSNFLSFFFFFFFCAQLCYSRTSVLDETSQVHRAGPDHGLMSPAESSTQCNIPVKSIPEGRPLDSWDALEVPTAESILRTVADRLNAATPVSCGSPSPLNNSRGDSGSSSAFEMSPCISAELKIGKCDSQFDVPPAAPPTAMEFVSDAVQPHGNMGR